MRLKPTGLRGGTLWESEKRVRIHSRENLESTLYQAIRSIFWSFKSLKIQLGLPSCAAGGQLQKR